MWTAGKAPCLTPGVLFTDSRSVHCSSNLDGDELIIFPPPRRPLRRTDRLSLLCGALLGPTKRIGSQNSNGLPMAASDASLWARSLDCSLSKWSITYFNQLSQQSLRMSDLARPDPDIYVRHAVTKLHPVQCSQIYIF
jgi:hypothetical protein